MSYDLLVRAHLAFGTMALVSFWVQMVSRKGGALHRLGGRFYFAVMILVISTAIPMTLLLIRRDDPGAGLLLGFLGTITMSSGASALMAARWKGQHIERQRRISHGFSYMLLIVSLLLLGLTPWAGMLAFGARLLRRVGRRQRLADQDPRANLELVASAAHRRDFRHWDRSSCRLLLVWPPWTAWDFLYAAAFPVRIRSANAGRDDGCFDRDSALRTSSGGRSR